MDNNRPVGVMESGFSMIAKSVRKSAEVQSANELYRTAKKLYKTGAKTSAMNYLTKAEKLYTNARDRLYKLGDAKKVKVKATRQNTQHTYGLTHSLTKMMVENKQIGRAIDLMDDRIMSCKALRIMWSNKEKDMTFKMLKAKLREELKAQKLAKKATPVKESVLESLINPETPEKDPEFYSMYDDNNMENADLEAEIDEMNLEDGIDDSDLD